MKIEELEFGQWYYTPKYKHFYQFLGIREYKDGDGIKGHYLNERGSFSENAGVGNTDFWQSEGVRKAEYSEYEKWLPEKYKTQLYEIY